MKRKPTTVRKVLASGLASVCLSLVLIQTMQLVGRPHAAGSKQATLACATAGSQSTAAQRA
jgi:hypothetical protein